MTTDPKFRLILGNCLDVMRDWPDDYVDLIVCSPPYEDARTYGIDFRTKGEEWVEWMKPICREASRVCKGLVIVNCEGTTRQFRWSATPVLLMADLHREGRLPVRRVRHGGSRRLRHGHALRALRAPRGGLLRGVAEEGADHPAG